MTSFECGEGGIRKPKADDIGWGDFNDFSDSGGEEGI